MASMDAPLAHALPALGAGGPAPGCTVVATGAGAGAGAGTTSDRSTAAPTCPPASQWALVVWQPWAVAVRLEQPPPERTAPRAKRRAVAPASHRVSLDTATRIMAYMCADALRATACVSREWRRRANRVEHWVALCVAKWGVRPAEVSLPAGHAKELYRALELSWRRMRGSVLAPGPGSAGSGIAAVRPVGGGAPAIVLPVR